MATVDRFPGVLAGAGLACSNDGHTHMGWALIGSLSLCNTHILCSVMNTHTWTEFCQPVKHEAPPPGLSFLYCPVTGPRKLWDTHTFLHTYTWQTLIHIHVYSHTYIYTHTYTHTGSNTATNMHTHTHSQMRITYTYNPPTAPHPDLPFHLPPVSPNLPPYHTTDLSIV